MFSVNRKNIGSWQAAIALLTALLTAPAHAVDPETQLDGEGFSNACTRADEAWISFCNGYIQAVIDSIREADGVCLPSGTTRTDIVAMAEREITGSSRLRTMNAHDAVRAVLVRFYAC